MDCPFSEFETEGHKFPGLVSSQWETMNHGGHRDAVERASDKPGGLSYMRAALAEQQGTIGAEFLAPQFTRTRASRVAEILKTLAALGQATEVHGRYISRSRLRPSASTARFGGLS